MEVEKFFFFFASSFKIERRKGRENEGERRERMGKS